MLWNEFELVEKISLIACVLLSIVWAIYAMIAHSVIAYIASAGILLVCVFWVVNKIYAE